MRKQYPILEFDPTRKAIIEPANVLQNIDAPECCIFCFFQDVITQLKDEETLTEIFTLRSEYGPNPLYEYETNGQRIAVFHPGVSAPLAAAFMEEVIALGCRKFIAVGSCGVLDKEIAVGHLIVPTSAVRDEGVSYHYLPPAREVEPTAKGVRAIETVLKRREIPYLKGKTWTTDGFYRETPEKIKLRQEEGCLTVEMEAAAFFAVAKFRKVLFAQILYGSDDVSGSEWDTRRGFSRRDLRRGLFDLATEICLELG
ncbi:MAG: nucleoside phosphorylase [Calditrichaeota bacterium]|nr:nucleoside phosphorylase [Calditrichota bacterium]